MIRVVMADNKPVETYKTGTKFTVHQSTGNLSVYNDAKEEIAVHAHGTWASVSVDNTQNSVDKPTPPEVELLITKAIKKVTSDITDPNSSISRTLEKRLAVNRRRI